MNAIHEVNGIYNMAEGAKREGNLSEAIEFYDKAGEAYLGVVQVCENEEGDEPELRKRMEVFSESCKREVDILKLREELLNNYGESLQSNSCNFSYLKSSFRHSEGMPPSDPDKNSNNNQGELIRVKLWLEIMKEKFMKRLDSLEEAFLKLKLQYQRDIKFVLNDPSLTAKDINLKKVDICMADMKKYIDKVVDSSSKDFKREISLLNLSIRCTPLHASLMVKDNPALIEEECVNIEGLPPGITMEVMEMYLNEKSPPLFVTYEKYADYKHHCERIKKKLKKTKEAYHLLLNKQNCLIQEMEKLKS
ncbi:unnamed protein product [Moneuplotes crassus]|uniref:Uncharacterized protein n=1 Tax=Euplotes crassus TaxID=5936 RepID=A0AAD1XPJ8_EUPCR|nr:unnamed protein product [Moneuplotes crassus]